MVVSGASSVNQAPITGESMPVPRGVGARVIVRRPVTADWIAAIGMNKTHIDQITEKFPDQKLRVLVKGGALPNDVLLASATVAPEVIDAVRKTFTEHGPELLAAITATEENEKFIGGGFTPTVTDADYDGVRKMFENVGVTEFTQFVGE